MARPGHDVARHQATGSSHPQAQTKETVHQVPQTKPLRSGPGPGNDAPRSVLEVE